MTDPVLLTDTFDQWRVKCNDLIEWAHDLVIPDISGLVTLTTAQEISGLKDFTIGFTINGISVNESLGELVFNAGGSFAGDLSASGSIASGTSGVIGTTLAVGGNTTIGGSLAVTTGGTFGANSSVTGSLTATTLINTGSTISLRGNTYTLPAADTDGLLNNVGGTTSWLSIGDLVDLLNEIVSNDITLAKGILPVGTIVPYVAEVDVAPTGWLFCRGQLVPKASYTGLIGLGIPESGANYIIPDLQGKVILGVSSYTEVNDIDGTIDLTGASDYFKTQYIIKVEPDAVAVFNISESNGILITGNVPGGGFTDSIGFAGGTIGLDVNTSQFKFVTGKLNLFDSISNTATASTLAKRGTDASIRGFTPVSGGTDHFVTVNYLNDQVSTTATANKFIKRGTDASAKGFTPNAPAGDHFVTVNYLNAKIASLNLDEEPPDPLAGSDIGKIKGLISSGSDAFLGATYLAYGYVTADGRAKVWGASNGLALSRFGASDSYGMDLGIPYPRTVKKLYVSEGNSYIIADNDKLYSRGRNHSYAKLCLSSGSQDYYNYAVEACDGESIAKVVIPQEYNQLAVGAITTDGELWVAGYNQYGSLGDGTNVGTNKVIKTLTVDGAPSGTQIGKVIDAQMVGSRSGDWRYETTYALVERTPGDSSTREVWACGYGGRGQMGQGHINNSNKVWSPVKDFSVSGRIAFTGISYTASTKVFTKTDHGFNRYDQIRFVTALGSLNTTTPYYIRRITSSTFSIYLTAEDAKNNTNKLGPVSNASGISAWGYKPITNVRSIHAGGHQYQTYCFLVKNNNHAWRWGDNAWGQLGDGSQATMDQPEYLDNGISYFKTSGFGGNFSYMVKTDGTCWFAGRESGLGNSGLGGAARYVTTFQKLDFGASNRRIHKLFVSNLGPSAPCYAVIRTGDIAVAPSDTYRFYGWGRNLYGELGTGDKDTNSEPGWLRYLPADPKLIDSVNIGDPSGFASTYHATVFIKNEDQDTGYAYVAGRQRYGHNNSPSDCDTFTWTRFKI